MKPYYQHAGITIYHASCLDVMPLLEDDAIDCIVTDPVWPNVPPGLYAGADDPYTLFTSASSHFPRITDRVAIQLGCNSDPRFLSCMPDSLPFLRVCWLEYAVPGRRGRLLYSGDVAYIYGTWPISRKGARVFPGNAPKAQPHKNGHPTPRAYEHVRWLVGWYARGVVFDPFMGSGQTLRAAKEHGYAAIGCEVNESYCEVAALQLQQEVLL